MADLHELVCKVKEFHQAHGRRPTRPEFAAMGVSEYAIRRVGGYNAIVKAAGLETYHQRVPSALIELPKPKPFKILFLDIETSVMSTDVFALGEQYLQINQIQKDWKILSFAAKFHDEEKVHYLDLRHEKEFDDSMLLVAIQHLFSQSTYVIGHNLARFDVPKINARMIKHNMSPVQDYKIVDTLRIARKHFKFTSNKLEYLANYLGCTPKSKHKKFHGIELWQECEKHNPEAWEEIFSYNVQDVYTLIEVWEKLMVWDNSKNGKLLQAVYGKN